MKNNIKLSKKAAKYSLLASAAIAMLAGCAKEEPEPNDPNINDTDIDPDISITAPTNNSNEVLIDINDDGVTDIAVGLYNYNYTYGGLTTNVNYSYLAGLNGAKVLTQDEIITFNGYVDTSDVVSALSAGNMIGPSQLTWLDESYLAVNGTYYGLPISFGQFLGQDKYVGVKFLASGNTHYAWVRLSMNADGSNVMIKEYAYHINPNTAIEAGAK